jgi:malonyl-CoA O-methyltransferase
MNVKAELCKAFNHTAFHYDRVALIQHEIGERLFARLSYLNIKPQYVLDLGCGTGVFSQCLKKQYPDAQIIGLDLAVLMLKQAKAKQKWWKKSWSLVNADMLKLPFASGIFDVIFSNQVIHWSPSLQDLFRELNRVMNVNGCLMFSTLGPNTFTEIRQAWACVDKHQHANHFIDMHDVGDCLMSEYFIDPVVDMEILTAHYQSLDALVRSLKNQGVRNINAARHTGLTGKQSWKNFEQSMQKSCTPDGKFPLTYEVVYGHAWKGEQRRFGRGTETVISIDKLRAFTKEE